MNIKVIKSNRKSIAIEIKRDLQIIVRTPLLMKDSEIQQFVNDKSKWIEKHIAIVREQNEIQNQIPKFTIEEIHKLADKALEVIPQRVKYYAEIMGVRYGKITIRNQVSRWGSCSAKGNLNFNCLLMLCPSDVLDYVVVHELCHIKEMNHSKSFWNYVAQICPEYNKHRQWLKGNGNELIRRLR